MEPEKKSDLDKKWKVLINYDSDARAAVQKLEKYGPEAVDKLREVYTIIGNKTQFSFIADQIASDCQKDAASRSSAAAEAPPDEQTRENTAKGTSRKREKSHSIFGISAVLSSALSLFILPIFIAPIALILGAVALLRNEKHGAALVVIVIIVLVVSLFNFFKFDLQSGIM